MWCFVEALNEQEFSDFNAVVAAVTRKLEEGGCTLSDDLVREVLEEILLEMSGEVGDEEE